MYRTALPALESALARVGERLASPDAKVRAVLQDLDTALRGALGLASRPYVVAQASAVESLADELELSPAQLAELDEFARWLKYRDGVS